MTSSVHLKLNSLTTLPSLAFILSFFKHTIIIITDPIDRSTTIDIAMLIIK